MEGMGKMIRRMAESKRFDWFVIYAVSLLAVFVVETLPGAEDAVRPNIIFILADDLGYGDLGCYGSRVNRTPHIDALAESGLRFVDFHAAGPMCSPTRAATLTGQYQQRFGSAFDTALSGTADHDFGLPHAAITLAELLRDQGYATACFGKWHLGYQPPWLPTSQGFDVFRGLGSGDGDYHTHMDRSGNEDWWHNDSIEMTEGYTTELLTQYAVDFIETHRQRPFFLYVPHLAVHFPWQGPNDPPHRRQGNSYHEDKFGMIPEPGNVAPHVQAMVESLDGSVGEIVRTLQQWQLQEKTVIIFSSDNGGYLNYGSKYQRISSNGPLRGQKTELYEGGHRVPTIVSWPGSISAGTRDVIGHSVDWLPTLATIAGVRPERYKTDGIDLGPILLEGKDAPDRILFWRAREQAAVRHGPWKLHRNSDRTELYHLGRDLGEKHDLAAEHPQTVQRLSEAWAEWEAEVNETARLYER